MPIATLATAPANTARAPANAANNTNAATATTMPAPTFIKEYGLEDRIEIMSSDYNQDPIGEGYDLIWAKATIAINSADDLDSLMKKIYDALNSGGGVY